MLNQGWDAVFAASRWGRYPPLELVRFVARHYYSFEQRRQVKLLEVGCGPAANLWYIAREGFSAFGIDGSSIALRKAEERLAEEGVHAELKHGDAMSLPYEDAFFDGVFDIECVYANSEKDARHIITEIHRVLKPGGAFFSMAFMTGSDGDGKGRRLEGETHTYIDVQSSVLNAGYHGVTRFIPETAINEIYGIFPSITYEFAMRSENNRNSQVKEWLITCVK